MRINLSKIIKQVLFNNLKRLCPFIDLDQFLICICRGNNLFRPHPTKLTFHNGPGFKGFPKQVLIYSKEIISGKEKLMNDYLWNLFSFLSGFKVKSC